MSIATLFAALLIALPALDDPARVAEFESGLVERAESGDADAAYWLGRLQHDLVPLERRDYASAREWLERASADGHVRASEMLARIHEVGFLVPADRGRAAGYYARAADAGSAAAAFHLARLALTAEPRDLAAAHRQLARAVAGGNAPAMQLLARLYANGLGVEADAVEALKWAVLAREHGGGDDAVALLRTIAAAVPESAHEQARARAREWLQSR